MTFLASRAICRGSWSNRYVGWRLPHRRVPARLSALGSIPFGLLLTKLAGTEDLRSIGSGSIGAPNVLLTGRKSLAAVTLIGGALEGTLAVVIAGYYGGPNAAMLAALGAFLRPPVFGLAEVQGSKCVAVYIGVLIGLFWPAALIFCAMWLATAFTTRYSSCRR